MSLLITHKEKEMYAKYFTNKRTEILKIPQTKISGPYK